MNPKEEVGEQQWKRKKKTTETNQTNIERIHSEHNNSICWRFAICIHSLGFGHKIGFRLWCALFSIQIWEKRHTYEFTKRDKQHIGPENALMYTVHTIIREIYAIKCASCCRWTFYYWIEFQMISSHAIIIIPMGKYSIAGCAGYNRLCR